MRTSGSSSRSKPSALSSRTFTSRKRLTMPQMRELNGLFLPMARSGAYTMGIKVEVDYLRALLTNEIVKRDLSDGEDAKAAFQNVKRLQKRAAARKKSSENVLEEKPIVAPVEDASGYLPRAAVGTSEKVH